MGLIDQSKDSASRKSFLIFLTKIISTIINVVGFYFVANYLGPEVIGTVVFAGGFIGLFSFLVDPGLNITHIKNLAQGQDIGKCNGIYFSLKAYLILLTVLVIIVALLIYKKYFDSNLSSDFNLVFLITLVGAIFGYVYNAISTTYSGMILTAKQELPEYIGLTAVPIKIAVAVNGMGAIFLAMANTIGVFFSFIASIFLFKGIKIEKTTYHEKKEYISFSIPLAIVEILRTISIHSDKVLLHYFCGPASVGYLYAAQRVINLIDYFIISIRKVFFPLITKSIEEGDKKIVCKHLNKTIFTLLFILLPIVIFLSVFSKQIIVFIAGNDFKQSYIILIILSISVIFQGIGLMFSSIVIGSGDNLLYRRIGALTYFFIIVLNLFLVPNSLLGLTLPGLGAVGVSISILLGSFFNFVWYFLALKKKFSFNLSKNSYVVILSSIILFLILYTISKSFYYNNVIITFFAVLLSNLFFVLVIYFLGGISKSALRGYVDLLNIFRMRDYILKELRKSGK